MGEVLGVRGGRRPPAAVDAAPLSFAQERLWSIQQLAGATGAYTDSVGARLHTAIDTDALQRALDEVVRRHAALRTSFAMRDPEPVQLVADAVALELQRLDVSGHDDPEAELDRLSEQLASAPFDLARAPAARAALIQVAEEDQVLLLVMHQLVCDGLSAVVITRELSRLYRAYVEGGAAPLPPAFAYTDYARRERARLRGAALDAALAPWRERLAGVPTALDLPTDHPRAARLGYRGATRRLRLDAAIVERVRAFSRRAGATPFATLLAAFNVLMHRYTGQETIVVGTATAGRDRQEFRDAVGLFARTVALRTDVEGPLSFRRLVRRVHAVVLDAVAHQEAPFERLVAELPPEPALSRPPIFEVFFAVRPAATLDLPGAEPFHAATRASVDLTVSVQESPEGLELVWEYAADLFDAGTVQRLQRHFLSLLSAGLSEPERRLDELPMLSSAERQELLDESGAVARAYPVACLHALFEEQAARRPGAPAVICDGQTISYAELNARANRLAHRLRDLGIGAESLVALFLDRSVELIVAVLAVLKSGGAYVPLDPQCPPARVAFMLADTRARVLLTQEQLRGRLPDHVARVVCLDDRPPPGAGAESSPAPGSADAENLPPVTTPENLAYVIYTSGSTGEPKGVEVEHRQVARLLSATDHWYGLNESDAWVLAHSYAFDVSVWEMWGALAVGGCVVVAPFWVTRSPRDFAALLVEHRVTVLCNTPSLFHSIQDELLVRSDDLALRYVIFGGEALRPASLRPWFDRFGEHGPRLINQYGITETTVHSTCRVLRPEDCARDVSPIGVPIPDLDLYLLDPRGEPVPHGVAGEIYIGGAGVARGYLNRPELTAQRFIDNPLGPGRLYRSGDLARRLPDGEIAFIGRIDEQVKIRGFRVEPGEVASVADEHEGVACTAVVAVRAGADARLAAYVVPAVSEAPRWCSPARLREDLRAHLESKLPAYMVPRSITFVHELPLTANGKLDRRRLPAPEWEKASFVAPRAPTEQRIAALWRDALAVQRVGAQDNFFDLGGHSLLAAALVGVLRERLGVEVGVRALFDHPTLAALAEHLDSLSATGAGAVARPGSADGARPVCAALAPAPAREGDTDADADADTDTDADAEPPLSFQQRSLLFFDALESAGAVYNQAWAVRVTGELDADALRSALSDLAERQQALCTIIAGDGAEPRQLVVDPAAVGLETVDLSVDLSAVAADRRESELERQVAEYGRRPFDLARDVPLRAALIAIGPTEHVLAFGAHHIALDGWAVGIMLSELAELYAAAAQGRSARLPALTWSYGDYARWQRERLRGAWLARELDFWRRQLAGAPAVLALPTDRRRPAKRSFEGATHRFSLDGELSASVRDAGRARGATPYMVLMAAFATLLYRLSGQPDIVLGGPVANRDHPALKNLIGFCANTVAIRVALGGNPTFEELIGRVRDSVLAVGPPGGPFGAGRRCCAPRATARSQPDRSGQLPRHRWRGALAHAARSAHTQRAS